jgi:soluble lytic murein transglycosylase
MKKTERDVMKNSAYGLNIICLAFIFVFSIGFFIRDINKERQHKKETDKIFNEITNIKLRINKNALEIKAIKNIIDNVPQTIRERNSEEAFIIAEEIVNTANRYKNVSASLLTSIIYNESRFNRYAVSIDGAMGLGQLMPETTVWICKEWNIVYSDSIAFNPIFNIRATAWYYDWLYKHPKICRMDKERVLAYYNGGGKQAHRWSIYRKQLNGITLDELEKKYVNKLASETKKYVHDVIHHDSLFQSKINNVLPMS